MFASDENKTTRFVVKDALERLSHKYFPGHACADDMGVMSRHSSVATKLATASSGAALQGRQRPHGNTYIRYEKFRGSRKEKKRRETNLNQIKILQILSVLSPTTLAGAGRGLLPDV